MNTSGFIRSYMVRKVNSERFIIHVATTIERQLQEWSHTYEVILMKLQDYEFIIKCGATEEYFIKISEIELKGYQTKAPYALDRFIWHQLIAQGLKIKNCGGNYLDMVFPT